MTNNDFAANEDFIAITNRNAVDETLADEYQGLDMSFDRIKLPTGGGTKFEIPSPDGNGTETADEITGIIVYNHPAYAYYKSQFEGEGNPPDCASFDGKTGVGKPGGNCTDCPYNKFGSGNGQSKACRNKRQMYILRTGDLFPCMLILPTGSIRSFTNYVKFQLSCGRKLSEIVSKITLRETVSASGFTYSQAVFTFERMLTEEERKAAAAVTDMARAYAAKLTPATMTEDDFAVPELDDADPFMN